MEAFNSGLGVFRISLLMVILCTCLMQHGETAVKIVSPTENQIIRYRNQSVLFNCTVTAASSNSNQGFEWQKNNAKFSPEGLRQDALLWSSFELKNLSVKDEGEYVCKYDEAQDAVIVHLAAKPEAWNVGLRTPIYVSLDERAVLQCKAEGWPRPRIIWMKDNMNITHDPDHQYVLKTTEDSKNSTTSKLTIIAMQKYNRGRYTCVATNAVGVGKYNFRVDVREPHPERYKPSITAKDPKHTVEIGEDATLICLGEQVWETDLTTFLYWEFHGTRLNTSTNYYKVYNDTFTHQDDGSTPKVEMRLKIFDVDWSDQGNYTCVVDSFWGRVNDTIALQVKEKKHDWDVLIIVFVLAPLFVLALIFCLVWQHKKRRRKKKIAKLAQKYAREAHDDHFQHDVFVSYSSKDYNWIKDYLQPVFDQNNINYIIHSRDFIPGKAFFENMADSVYNSRKVILVMSKNYLSSGFCKDEMHMALFRAAQRDDGSLIVVKVGDIKPNEIPKSLRHKTFIDYTSREEVTTWKDRILEFVLSQNRLMSVSADESAAGSSDTISLILSKFKLKRKKKQNVRRDVTYQSC